MLADFIQARGCKPFCAKLLTLPIFSTLFDLTEGDIDKSTKIEILADISKLPIDYLTQILDIKLIIKLYIDTLKNYVLDKSYCHRLLNYSICCNFLCNISEDQDIIYTHSKNIFKLINCFPHKCKGFLSVLYQTAIFFLQLENKSFDKEKEELLCMIKDNENFSDLYYDLLVFSINGKHINEFNLLVDDVNEYNQQANKSSEAFNAYCHGQHETAKILFFELTKSKFINLANNSKTNLSFIIRRKETVGSYDFLETISSVTFRDSILLMNIMLYYVGSSSDCEEMLNSIKEEFRQLPQSEWTSAIECWSNVKLVGEKESKLALSLIDDLRYNN